jgi:hypothetical protein
VLVKKTYKYFSLILFILFLINTFIILPSFSHFESFESHDLRIQAICYHTDALLPFLECKSKILALYLNYTSIYGWQFLMFAPMAFIGSFGLLVEGEVLGFLQYFSFFSLQIFLIVSQLFGAYLFIIHVSKFNYKKIKRKK